MPRVGFEPTISAGKRPKTYVLDCAATGTGFILFSVPKNIQFHNINLDQRKKEKDFETCASKLNVLTNNFTIICIYKSPTGNFSSFLNQLEKILKKIIKHQVS